MELTNVQESTIYVLDPETTFFLENLGNYGMGVIKKENSNKDYLEFLWDDPNNNGETISIVSEEIAIFPDNFSWGIYGSRSWEIGVIGLRDIKMKEKIIKISNERENIFYPLEERIGELDEMLHFSSKAKRLYSVLLKNYSD